MMDTRIFGARNTFVKEIPINDAVDFLKSNHRAKSTNLKNKVVSLGIFSSDELLAVAQFCYPRTMGMKRKYTTELLRLAFKKHVRVPGGASKLIRHYIREYKPADLFTYQDTSGEATSVYEHAGMTLVSQAKKKQYLVAPGKTLETAGARESYSIASVAMRGPDALLGTKLGEIFREDGSRKSNPQLFIEELGWHVEETSGDRVYEWVDPDRTYYTYKITAADSDKYYYGVSHVKKANATVEDCLNDGYFGSGGKHSSNKFANWKSKHIFSLEKTVLNRYERKASALLAEKILIGEAWKTNDLCLNSVPGGVGSAANGSHGGISIKSCVYHGPTKHRGDNCIKCQVSKLFSIKACNIHGETTFHVNSCVKCSRAGQFVNHECSIHGLSLHTGNSCVKCSRAETIMSVCDIHGKTSHQGGSCSKCSVVDNFSVKTCRTHGETTFLKESCVSCSREKSYTKQNCPEHGSVTFRGNKCQTCAARERTSYQECIIHGVCSHYSGVCQRCSNSKTFQNKSCEIHGVTIFRGQNCAKCFANKGEKKVCPLHGFSTHYADKCSKCSSEDQFIIQNCEFHGEVKHRAGKCIKCERAKLNTLADCAIHGSSKHQGKNCVKCLRQKAAHLKHSEHKANCYFCSHPFG